MHTIHPIATRQLCTHPYIISLLMAWRRPLQLRIFSACILRGRFEGSSIRRLIELAPFFGTFWILSSTVLQIGLLEELAIWW